MLECDIRVSRPGNLLHVVNNLAEWHPACRRHYNGPWLAETGPLAERERAALDRYRWVVAERGYGYGRRWLGRAFGPAAGEAEAWERVRSVLQMGEAEAAALREALEVLEPRFQRLWERDRPRLERLAERLDAALAGDGVAQAVSAVERYLGGPAPRVTIDLLTSRGPRLGGGANDGPGRISLDALEVPGLAVAVDVVLHEVSHLMEAHRFMAVFDRFSDDPRLARRGSDPHWDARFLLMESLTAALFPGGCLSHLYGAPAIDHAAKAQTERAAGDPQRAGLYELTGLIEPLVRSYVARGLAVDEALFEQALAILDANPHTLS